MEEETWNWSLVEREEDKHVSELEEVVMNEKTCSSFEECSGAENSPVHT